MVIPLGDGSKEWTPEWLEKLEHKFGDDGDFWISFQDLMRKYQAFERTRLFGSEWRVAQIWTTLTIPWTLGYHDTYFSFEITKAGPVVIVLSQLDDRYFRGLQGQYYYDLAFRLHKTGKEDYLVRSQAPYRMRRSTNVELELEAGVYEVRVKISAIRDERLLPIEEVIRRNAKFRREKLIRIGLAYDLAHGKGKKIESPEQKAAREDHEKKIQEKEKAEIKKKILASREEAHYLKKKKFEREQKKRAKRSKKFQKKHEGVKGSNSTRAGSASEVVPHGDDGAESKQGPQEPPNGKQAPTPTSGQPNGLIRRFGESDDDGADVESMDSLSELSERELDLQIESYRGHSRASPTSSIPHLIQGDPDEFETDPWNAAVVVGLRVYHRICKDGNDDDIVKLKVVRPNDFSDDEDGDDVTEKTDKEDKGRGLDVDDSAKDATLEGGVQERKKSIMGDGRQKEEELE
jgi:hypothetical protein